MAVTSGSFSVLNVMESLFAGSIDERYPTTSETSCPRSDTTGNSSLMKNPSARSFPFVYKEFAVLYSASSSVISVTTSAWNSAGSWQQPQPPSPPFPLLLLLLLLQLVCAAIDFAMISRKNHVKALSGARSSLCER